MLFTTDGETYRKKQRHKIAQSIFTHYSCFENMGRFVTLKKGPKYGLQKAGCNPYFEPFFKVPDPKKISCRPNKLE